MGGWSMTDTEIPWAFDLLHNPDARADWESRHPGRAAEMKGRFLLRLIDHGRTEGSTAMAMTTEKENAWLDKATAAAIASARKIALNSSGLPMMTPIGRLNDSQWGWVITAAIFAWVQTRVEQAIEEGLDQEQAVRMTGLSPSPCDVAVVSSVLPALADQAVVDWSLPLSAWSKDVMTNFLLLAWQLMNKAETARDHGPGKIVGKSKDWDTKGDDISDIPFARRGS
jgi:hypothetical protein